MVVLKIFNVESTSNEPPLSVLEVGEHTLGRNSIEDWKSCKIISRTHFTVTVEENQANFQLIHVNPIYYIPKETGVETTLKKDASVKIADGDKFSFSKNTWYEFHIETDEATPSSLKRSLEELDSNGRKKLKTINDTLDHLLDNLNAIKDEDFSGENCATQVDGKNTVEMFKRKEVSDSDDKDSGNSDTDMADVTRDVETVTNVIEKSADVKKEPIEDSGEKQLEETSQELEVKKEEVSESDNDSSKDDPVPNTSNQEENNGGDETVKEETPAGTSGENTDNLMRREQCWYGGNCYRKNSEHRKEFSHPGDSDYDRDPSTDDRPDCGFGAQCYRTNPEHRRQYKHPTSRPAPKTRRNKRRAAVTKRVDDGDSETEDDEDPYSTDGSSSENYDDSGSDFSETPDFEDDDGEEVKEMFREAKKFLRKNPQK